MRRDHVVPAFPSAESILGDRQSRWPLFAFRAAGSLFREPLCLRKRDAVSPSPLTAELSFHLPC